MKNLALLLAFAGLLVADPQIIEVRNMQPRTAAPSVLSTPLPPFVVVMLYDQSPAIDKYTVTLPWVDQSGAPQTTTQDFPANLSGTVTLCVFDVDAASVGTPNVTAVPFARVLVKKR